MGIYNIGNIIKELRKKKSFSQKQLAEGICSVEYISKIENNKKSPSQDITAKLMTKLGADPNMFFSHLSYMDNEAHQVHCFELDALISQSEFAKAKDYIHELEKNYSFYSSGEPKQYLMAKLSHILTNLDKKFDEAYRLALNAIKLTKPDFTIDNMHSYEFYSINELWALIYMSSALFWKERDINRGTDVAASIELGRIVFTHLEKGYLQPSLIGTIYTSACFYLSRYLAINNRIDESMIVTDKGIAFVISHYNQIIELLGKIYCNKAYLTYCNGAYNESKRLSDKAGTLIKLANNETTIERYLHKTFMKTIEKWTEES